MPQNVNLVFQGGGVKGIAFAGALTALEEPAARERIAVKAVGGVSVGAMTAVLYAAGYSAQELTAELAKKPVHSLLRERPPRNNAAAAWRLWRKRGLYATEEIERWLGDLLAAKGKSRFGQLSDCRIVATNVTDGSYETYTTVEHAGDLIVPLVIKSLSIPLFFTPYADGSRLFVDGGLLSNYPLWLFADSPLVTVGLRLVGDPWHGATTRSGLFDYLKGLLSTMLTAHDREGRGKPPNVVEIPIKATSVKSTDFRIEDNDQQHLFDMGRLAVTEFPWDTLPPTRSVVFNDPDAGEVLENTANNLEKLFNRETANRPVPNKRRYELFELKHYINETGWVDMEWHYILKNNGPGHISMLRYGFEYGSPEPISFKELKLVVECGPRPHEAVALPIENTALAKGWALAFTPPIAPGESREVTMKYRSPDFKKLVQRERDLLGVEITHEDGIAVASITLELPRKLGTLTVSNDRGATPCTNHGPVQSRESTGYAWHFQNVERPLHLKVDLDLR